MNGLGTTSFQKTAACPSETMLVSYNSAKLSVEIMTLIRFHLSSCDFCSAELFLLDFYSRPKRGAFKVPEIPMNLRILAESLLQEGGSRPIKRKRLKVLVRK